MVVFNFSLIDLVNVVIINMVEGSDVFLMDSVVLSFD